MKLVVARSGQDIARHHTRSLAIDRTEKERDVFLCLGVEAYHRALEHGVETAVPDLFVTNEVHRTLLRVVKELGHAWCEPEDRDLGREGLGLDELFRYEFEQSFSAFLFDLYCVTQAVTKFRPRVLCLPLHAQPSTEFHSKSLVESLKSFCDRQSSAVVDTFASAPVVPATRKLTLNYKIAEALTTDLLTNVAGLWRQWLLPPTAALRSKTIVMNVQRRKIGLFLKALGPTARIDFLPIDGLLRRAEADATPHDLQMPTDCVPVVRLGLDVSGWIARFRRWAYQRAHIHSLYRDRLAALIDTKAPQLYVTTNVATALDKLTLLTFKNHGVHTIVLPEGLGHLSDDVWQATESALGLRLDCERWVHSETLADRLRGRLSGKNPIRVTGYLDTGFARPPDGDRRRRANRATRRHLRLPPPPARLVLFVSSAVPAYRMRLWSEETEFEIVEGVRMITSVITRHPTVTLVVKPHLAGLPLDTSYRHVTREADNVVLAGHLPMRHLIDVADVVVTYQSSAGLEALFRRKHLIILDHTGRPNYLTGILDGLNRDPQRGPCVRTANSEAALDEALGFLLSVQSSSAPSPGLERFLANAQSSYDALRTIKHAADGGAGEPA